MSSWISSISLLAVIIMSLLGIKIWWFKRRLDFVQTPTRNIGADKDRRLSQEVSDSVATHGVFRKRNEDELEIFERPRQLPPIRIQARSINRTALIPLPHTEPMNLRPTTEVVQELPDPVFDDRHIDVIESDSIIKPIRTEEVEQHINDASKTSVESDWTFDEVKPKVISETPAEITTTTERQSFEINAFQGIAEIQLKEKKVEVVAPKVQLDSLVLYYKDLETVKNLNDEDNFITESQWHNITDSEPTYHIEEHSDLGVSDTPVYQQEVSHTSNQEFEKIRHSFQHHEGHFLELNQSFNQILHSPTGYGKSIDEDWENFEDLIKTTMLEQKPKDVDTKLSTHFVHSSKTSNQIAEYVQNIEELYDDLSDNDNAITTMQNSPSILKVHHELNCKSTDYKFPYRKAKKLKAQQKVTFDVHTEEYYLTESDSESEVGTSNIVIPTPMQRTTNIQYNIEHIKNDNSNERDNSSTAFHYNTQILFDSPIKSRDPFSSNGTPIDLPSLIIQPAPRYKRRQSAES